MDYNRIREVRKAAGITQEQLAKSLGVNRATLSRYESGDIDPPSSQLQRIADALNVELWELMGYGGGSGSGAGFGDGTGYGGPISNKDRNRPEIEIPSDLTPDEAKQLVDEIAQIAAEASENISVSMNQLRQSMTRLNDAGKQKVLKQANDYAQDLVKIQEYQAPQPSTETKEDTDTTPPPNTPETPPEG